MYVRKEENESNPPKGRQEEESTSENEREEREVRQNSKPRKESGVKRIYPELPEEEPRSRSKRAPEDTT